jgi:FtsH-binding integral membrane protein
MSQQDSRIYFDPPTTAAVTTAARRGEQSKQFLGKVAKLVPVEIVGAYKAATLLVPLIKPDTIHIWFYWGLFALGLVGTFWYVGWRMTGFAKQRHLLVYCAAYVVWAYAVSGKQLLPEPYYQDALAGIVLIIASVIFGNIKLPAKESR